MFTCMTSRKLLFWASISLSINIKHGYYETLPHRVQDEANSQMYSAPGIALAVSKWQVSAMDESSMNTATHCPWVETDTGQILLRVVVFFWLATRGGKVLGAFKEAAFLLPVWWFTLNMLCLQLGRYLSREGPGPQLPAAHGWSPQHGGVLLFVLLSCFTHEVSANSLGGPARPPLG